MITAHKKLSGPVLVESDDLPGVTVTITNDGSGRSGRITQFTYAIKGSGERTAAHARRASELLAAAASEMGRLEDAFVGAKSSVFNEYTYARRFDPSF